MTLGDRRVQSTRRSRVGGNPVRPSKHGLLRSHSGQLPCPRQLSVPPLQGELQLTGKHDNEVSGLSMAPEIRQQFLPPFVDYRLHTRRKRRQICCLCATTVTSGVIQKLKKISHLHLQSPHELYQVFRQGGAILGQTLPWPSRFKRGHNTRDLLVGPIGPIQRGQRPPQPPRRRLPSPPVRASPSLETRYDSVPTGDLRSCRRDHASQSSRRAARTSSAGSQRHNSRNREAGDHQASPTAHKDVCLRTERSPDAHECPWWTVDDGPQ